MAFLKNVRKVPVKVEAIKMRIGTKGLLSEEEDVKELKDLRSFAILIEVGTEDYHTFESGEYQISDIITRAVGLSWSQNRIEGDEVSDYLASTPFGVIENLYAAIEYTVPGGYGMRGAYVLKPGEFGGDPQNLLIQSFEASLSGKPEIITPDDETNATE